ncbi:MAG: sodium:solute symporter [Verrucomicrobia bacterium]|nr:sodium:solute symporter [Verrucomicrobiota bacterium]
MLAALRTADVVVLFVYFAVLIGAGFYFRKRSGTVDGFTVANRSLPGWVVGLSVFGTYLSSNTFIGVPGQAYGTNWNGFVFSLSLPIAAFIAVKWFVPFYRRHAGLSAYEHLETRFGAWARVYAVVCYLLTQVSRVGTIMFGVAMGLHALTGWDIAAIILVSGFAVTLYTLLGGIEAVIWTDAIQSVILTLGAIVVVVLILTGMPEGPGEALRLAGEAGKFSFGDFGASLAPVKPFAQSTFWVMLAYGIVMNLTNFGIDQNFVQRYHAADSEKAAGRSVWMGALMYMPVALMFFFIGAILFSYYEAKPDLLQEVKLAKANEMVVEDLGLAKGSPEALAEAKRLAEELAPNQYGDKVLPHFIANKIPAGLAGLLIAALFAAAMSSIDTSLNSSSTIALQDFYRRWAKPGADEAQSLLFLRVMTVVWGVIGTGVALALIDVQGILDVWWKLSGVFAGGMLGLFLLGFISRRANNAGAVLGAVVGLLVILWLTFSPEFTGDLEWLRSPFHAHMTSIIGTLSIFLIGLGASQVFGRKSE